MCSLLILRICKEKELIHCAWKNHSEILPLGSVIWSPLLHPGESQGQMPKTLGDGPTGISGASSAAVIPPTVKRGKEQVRILCSLGHKRFRLKLIF